MSKQGFRQKNLLQFEVQVQGEGFQHIAGVDEVGRGCLAGPVVAACVMLPWHENFQGVNDSKQLKKEERERLYPLIVQRALAFGVGIVEAKDIDRMNIGRASLKAMRLAIESLQQKPDFVLVDGCQKIPLLNIPQLPIPKGDSLSLSIAAASIVAKVTRDRMMEALDRAFPRFSFGEHKGYGTKKHLDEIKTHGPTSIHRLSFRGVT